MLFWKLYRIAWTAHANADAQAPSWVVNPARITSLHPRLTELTPVMVQALGKQKDVTVDRITAKVIPLLSSAFWQEYKWCPAGNIMGSAWCGITCITKAVPWWQVSRTSVQLGEPNGNDGAWTMTGLTDLWQEYKWCPAGNIMGSAWCGITCIDGAWTMTGTKCAAIKRLISIMRSGDKT